MLTLPSEIQSVLDTFKEKGLSIYVVGGSTRNLLQNIPVHNWDFATNATPEQILSLFSEGFYNNQFGTVGIEKEIAGEKTVLEITTFRKESEYKNLRHPEKVEWASTIEEDLARRDFTINAIATDGKRTIDLFGGMDDFKNKTIRAVGDPHTRFNEDALRLLRAVRFATQLKFTIEPKTLSALQQNASLIKKISWERIRDELLKIISFSNADEGILLLRETGLLTYILPELEDCFSIDQKSPERHHIYDVGTHLVMSLKHSPSKDIITRFATLLHDIGKSKTYRKDPETGIITFYNHEVIGTIMAREIAERLRLSNKQKEKLLTLIRYHQFTVSELQTDKAVRRFIRQIGKENIQDMLDVRLADRIGSGAKPTSWRFDLFKKRLEEVQKEPFKVTDLTIDGKDVMDLLQMPPGPKVGQILNNMFQQVVDNKLPNDRTMLLEKLRALKS